MIDEEENISEISESAHWQNKLGVWVKDPWVWACDTVYTKDAVDHANPIKRFPKQFEYLELFTKIWQLESRIAVPKSRRMFLSWHAIILHLWDAMLHPGRNIAFVSKKEDDANELVSRALFILENMKDSDWPSSLRPKFESKFNRIDFPELNSSIQGFPQGADQLRQFTFTRILADEMAFWDKAEDMYSASMPTLDGGGVAGSGGKFMAISSAAPGFFKRLVHDEITDEPAEAPRHRYPMQGVEVWRNARNKFVIFQLHYSANEAKRDPSYQASVKSDMPYSRYMQEYEISWETNQGKPVYPDWNRAVHGTKRELYPHMGTPLFLGVDQGLTPACIVFQPQGDQVVVICEYTAENMGAERFKEYVKMQLRKDFPAWNRWNKDFIVGMDPTAFNRRDVDERTYASVWQEEFDVYPGENSFEKRKQCVEDWLNKFRKGDPTFVISMVRCPVAVRGFDGEYHYPDKLFEVEPNKIRPLKNFAANCIARGQVVKTARGDIPIEDVLIGDLVFTPFGYKRVINSWKSGCDQEIFSVQTKNGTQLLCTASHLVFTLNRGYVYASNLAEGDICLNTNPLNTQVKNGSLSKTIIEYLETGALVLRAFFTGKFGRINLVKYPQNITYITKTVKAGTIGSKISRLLSDLIIYANTCLGATWSKSYMQLASHKSHQKNGMLLMKEEHGTRGTHSKYLDPSNQKNTYAKYVNRYLKQKKGPMSDSAQENVNRNGGALPGWMMLKEAVQPVLEFLRLTSTIKQNVAVGFVRTSSAGKSDVFDLEIEDVHCFYANGILVHNCHDALQYGLTVLAGSRPKRVSKVPTPSYSFGENKNGRRRQANNSSSNS